MLAMSRRARVEVWGARFLAGLGLAAVGPWVGCSAETSVPCLNGEAVESNGIDTGLLRCDGDWTHRPTATECESALPREDHTCSGEDGECSTDADCAGTPNGYCESDDFGQFCGCRSGCLTDADCGDGNICICGSPVGHCAQADCTDDTSCEENMLCSSYITEPGCGGIAYRCQTPEDECGGDADCLEGEQCSSDGAKKLCKPMECVIGRPFLVEGEERLAPTERRDDWVASDLAPDLTNLDLATRRELTSYWTEIARMEHASVAAFARFALQLLSLGAPPELVSRTHAAMADETRHATFAFSIASSYGDKTIGPGPLAMNGAIADHSVEDILRTVLLEGCLGETVASMEAAEALEHVQDPALRFVLREITRDEEQHALLAWRSVQWMYETFELEARPVLAEIVEQLKATLAGPASVQPSSRDEALLARGCVTPAVRSELRRGALARVVIPGLEAILNGAAEQDEPPASVAEGRRTLV